MILDISTVCSTLPHREIAAQGIGLLAASATILAFLHDDEDKMMRTLTWARVAWTLHYLSLGALTAGAGSVLGILQILCARRWRGAGWINWTFLALTLLMLPVTWTGPSSALVCGALVVSSWALNSLRGASMRWALLATSAFGWIPHNALYHSVGGITTELLLDAANLRTLWRMRHGEDAATGSGLPSTAKAA